MFIHPKIRKKLGTSFLKNKCFSKQIRNYMNLVRNPLKTPPEVQVKNLDASLSYKILDDSFMKTITFLFNG